MAEYLRRLGGKMESHRRPSGSRQLLPAETEFCEVLGITEEDYWQFCNLTELQAKKRSSHYDHIPDIRNEPASIFTQIIVSIIVGIVVNAITPKPKEQKPGPSLTTEDKTGKRRYTPQVGFDSVQDLAILGTTIPLVFANDPREGVRVNTQLIWSQNLSNGTYQQLKALFLLSAGQLGARPDFIGYAIGDLLLKNYAKKKLAIYFKDGRSIQNRILNTDKYPESELALQKDRNNIDMTDVFSVDSDNADLDDRKLFSGLRNPSTSVEFGSYNPMPNSMAYSLPYELILKPKDASNKDDITRKRFKTSTYFPTYAAVQSNENVVMNANEIDLYNGQEVRYEIQGTDPTDYFAGVHENYKPWGTEDIRSATEAIRENIDDSIEIGEQYLIGTALGVCDRQVNQFGKDEVWNMGDTKNYFFKITDQGRIDCRAGFGGGRGTSSGMLGQNYTFDVLTIQKAAVATVSNNRDCNVTEIGLKSTVFKRVSGFANVNSHPGEFDYTIAEGTVHQYEKDNGNIQLGRIDKYLKRYSFFRLMMKVGNNDWQYIDGGVPFCVEGRSPQPQYNFIRINHELGQYDYKFVPYPGNAVRRYFTWNGETSNPWRLRLFRGGREQLTGYSVNVAGLNSNPHIVFNGITKAFTANDFCNNEWFLGSPPNPADLTTIGVVKDFTPRASSGVIEAVGREFSPDDQPRDSFSFDEDDFDNWEYYKDFAFNNPEVIGGSEGTNLAFTLRVYANRHEGYDRDAPFQIFITNGGYGYKEGELINLARQEFTTAYQRDSNDDDDTDSHPVIFSAMQVAIRLRSPRNLATDPWPRPDDNGQVILDGSNFIVGGEGNAGENRNLNPFDAIADVAKYESETNSNDNEPEHIISYLNEQVINDEVANYQNLGLVGLRINSSKEWTTFNQISAYVKKGVKVERLIDDNGNETTNLYDSTNNFAEIAYSLLTNTDWGIGELLGIRSVDRDNMVIAAKFCRANGFTWSGVLSEKQNLREFIFEQAGYCLLDFCINGGKFSLFPAVPYKSDFTIDYAAKPNIRALFTDGNIQDLKVSFLTPEERQPFQGIATYRKEKENKFPEKQSIGLRLKNSGGDKLPRETFDLSAFCTSEEHAKTFLKQVLKVRKEVDHGLTFSTTPQAAMHLEPGQYFRVFSEVTHLSRFSNGIITSEGVIQAQKGISNGDTIFYWKPPTANGEVEDIREATLAIENGLAAAPFRGSVFTKAVTSQTDRVYKVESISYGEEGLIEVVGVHAPLTPTGSLETLNYNDDDFEEAV